MSQSSDMVDLYIKELSAMIDERAEKYTKFKNRDKVEEDYAIKDLLGIVREKLFYNPYLNSKTSKYFYDDDVVPQINKSDADDSDSFDESFVINVKF